MADLIQDYEVNSSRWLSLKDFEGETWKDILNYKSKYMVSNFGRIKSLERIIQCKTKNNNDSYVVVHSRILRNTNNRHGYLYVDLLNIGKSKRFYVHRLVAQAFIPNPLNLPCVNHKDENKSNNMVSNLEFCTQRYNNLYGTARTRGLKTRFENGNNRAIDMYDLNGKLLKHYDKAYHIERDGLSRRCVYNVCEGRTRSYKGCVFVFHGNGFRYRDKDHYPKGFRKEVVVTDKDGNIIKIYKSIKIAERENGLKRNYLYSATHASSRKAEINGMYFEIKRY